LPDGTYGISYDIFVNAVEMDPPMGWGGYRATVYRQFRACLNDAGFARDQYSDFQSPMTSAAHTWRTMMSLKYTDPPGRFETIIKAVKMYFMQIRVIFDPTDSVRLGGEMSHHLRGPTPRILVLPVEDILDHIPVQAPPGFRIPKHTRHSNPAENPVNWLVAL